MSFQSQPSRANRFIQPLIACFHKVRSDDDDSDSDSDVTDFQANQPTISKTFKLEQRHEWMGEKAQHVPADCDVIETGAMSECVSAILLWNRRVDGYYESARGYHGGGGWRAIDFESLTKGVPDEDATILHICIGPGSSSPYCDNQINEDIAERRWVYTVEKHPHCMNGKVNRWGEYSQ